MKLSNKVWIIVGVGIIVVLLAISFWFYFGQVREKQDLEDRQNEAAARSITLAADEEDLENQLSQAQSLLNSSQAQYAQTIHSIEYGEYLFEIAESCGVTLSSLSFPKPSSSKSGAVTYRVVALSLPISGTLENIFEFINTINTDDRFASTRVNSVNLNVGGGATISVTIYSYQG
jgi:hypothetical protein